MPLTTPSTVETSTQSIIPPQSPPAALPEPSRSNTSRSNLSQVALRLVSEYTAGRFTNNAETDLKFIELNASVLHTTYSNTLQPLVYGNFRAIGARTVTDYADTNLLDLVIKTVATNAVVATYAVCFSKAAKIDASSVNLFGNYNPVDSLRFPVLTTALINSLGPVETTRLPYHCKFIPYIQWNEVSTLMAQPGYTPHYYETFVSAMTRIRTIALSDVDVSTTQSSHWWTLYMDNKRATTNGDQTTPGHITAFNPFSFEDRDHTVILGSLVLEDTLYESPGPIISAIVGPFGSIRRPKTVDDIPDAFRSALSVNPHVPALHVSFTRIAKLNTAGALTFSELQDDDELTDVVDTTTFVTTEEDSEADEPSFTPATDLTKKRKMTTPRTRQSKATAPTGDILSSVGTEHSGIYVGQVLYFDHILLNRVPLVRRANIVTSANHTI